MTSTKFYQCAEHKCDLDACDSIHELRYQAETADHILIREAVSWIEDCFGKSHRGHEYSPRQPVSVIRVINRHYQGGWDQFIKDNDVLTDQNYEPQHALRLV
jgi:hypothetical protein